MEYHSEPITRRFVSMYEIREERYEHGEKNDLQRVANANRFAEEWERLSLSSTTQEDRSSYFFIGMLTFHKLSLITLGLGIAISALLNVLGIFIVSGLGLFLLPCLIFTTLWIAFKTEYKRAFKNPSYMPSFKFGVFIFCMISSITVAVGIFAVLHWLTTNNAIELL